MCDVVFFPICFYSFIFSHVFLSLSLARVCLCLFCDSFFFWNSFWRHFFYSKKHTNLIPATQFGTQSEHKVRTSTKALFGEKANTATSYSIWCWEREKKKIMLTKIECKFQTKWNEHECKSTSTSQINFDSRWCANFDEHQCILRMNVYIYIYENIEMTEILPE